MFTENALAQILPTLPADKRRDYAPLLQSAAAEFGINNPLRGAAFIAQIAHESQNLNRLVENLNYSAVRLRQVFPRRFPTAASAQAVAHQPERIANIIYANRIGNGPPESGDGFRYRGRGFIQLTGRANYREFGRLLGVDLEGNPDEAATPAIAFRVAAAFFRSRGCNELADQQAITVMTKRINGGTLGLRERINLFGKAKRILRPAAGVGPARGMAPQGSAPAGEGREVPPDLSRGIMPGEEFATAKRSAKKAGAKKAGGGKGSKGGVGAARGAAKKAGAKKGAAKKAGAKKGTAKKAGAKGAAKGGAKGGAKKGGAKGAAKKGAAAKSGAKKGAAKKGAAKKGAAKKGAAKKGAKGGARKGR